MEKYRHTQRGYMMLFLALFASFLSSFDLAETDTKIPFLLALVITIIIVLSFSSLTVSVDDEFLRIKFGYGIYKKKFLLSDIKSVTKVRNKWYYGWGIRLLNSVKIFNVSGLDAIEIVMQNDKKYRIGTDDIDGLVNVLNSK